MASVDPKPFPPGEYPIVVVGSGPGGLQMSAGLKRLGIEHAVVSSDESPGGMFRQFPLFQRLITWTKIHAPAQPGTRYYEWFDWNSLLSDEPDQRDLVRQFMDGTSYFPARSEMQRGLEEFCDRAGIRVRTNCAWTGTRRDDDGFVIETADGDYRCRIAIFAVGMTRPWKPPIPGLDAVPHYVDTKEAADYEDARVFIIGKRNSGFELADALLPRARQIVLGSPRPARISVLTRSTASARARYLQPYEDHVLGGGNLVLDAAIERVDRTDGGYRVTTRGTTRPGEHIFEADRVIAATGFSTPLGDLEALGVRTFHQGRLPSQTPYWESSSIPGIYFAGSVTQGSVGLKKYGIPSNSSAVHGFRYNARVLAAHIAREHFGIAPGKARVARDAAVGLLLDEATHAPELWNQQSYLARVLEVDPAHGLLDAGIAPLAQFVDSSGPDSIAITVETSDDGEIRPAVYLRNRTGVHEHVLPSDTLNDFTTVDHRKRIDELIGELTA